MSEVKSRYHSPRRREQAAATRLAVLEAARELFVAQGYGRTTLEQVAARASVSKPTVFTSVGSKIELFTAVRDLVMAGDDGPLPVSERPSVEAIGDADGLDHAVAAAARHVASLVGRYHEVHQVLQGAAGSDQAMASLYDESERQRLVGAGHLLGHLSSHGRPRWSPALTQDRLWILMAPDHYVRLVQARGWSTESYEAWLRDEIGALFEPPSRAGSP